jgi:hypothetical protein
VSHTPEPWKFTVPEKLIVWIDPDEDPDPPTMLYAAHPTMSGFGKNVAFRMSREDSQRAATCVNACRGLSNEMLAAVNDGGFQLVVTVKGDPTKVLSAITSLTSDQHVANTSGGETEAG